MLAIFVWWMALPSLVRRLIGAVFIGGAVLVSGLVVYKRHVSGIKDTAYKQGAAHVTDSVNAIAIKRLTVAETVYVHDATRTDSQIVKASHGAPVQHLVIQTVPIPVQDTELKVRVIVTAFHDTVDNVPVRAAQYWQRADSVAGLALWSAHQWHAAYIASDSVATLWRARALAPHEAPNGVTVTRVEKYAIRAGELYGLYRVARIVIQIAKR